MALTKFISGGIPQKESRGEFPLQIFTKNDYLFTLKERRRKFVHEYFSPILSELFETLRSEANKMRPCHHEVMFSSPDHFDIDKTEATLREYFKDLGFETISHPRIEGSTRITLTIT